MIQRILSNAEENVLLAGSAGEGFITHLASMVLLEATDCLNEIRPAPPRSRVPHGSVRQRKG
jgi:hypothetical protein